MNLIEETFKPLVEMANLRQSETGINGLTIYISQKEGQHGPRIKVYLAGQTKISSLNCSYSISDEPRKLVGKLTLNSKYDQLVKRWIVLNKAILLQLWNSNGDLIYITDILRSIKKV